VPSDLRAAPHEHRPHRWLAALSVVAVLLLVAACGLGTWFIVNDERKGPAETRKSASTPQKRDISSRNADAAPLTEAEVFPKTEIIAAPNEPPYIVLKTQASEDCKMAATDDIAALLATGGCSQVVRGTLKSPNGQYLITAGVFNLTDEKAAEETHNGVKPAVDAQKGRFTGMAAGTGTEAIVRAPTQLGWNFRGHFLAYCVIARADGQTFSAGDPYPQQIIFDMVTTYLETGVIGGRAVVQPSSGAKPSGSPAPASS
jgi:hypothetical protein